MDLKGLPGKNETKIQKELLAENLHKIKQEYNKKDHGEFLTILGPVIHAIANAAAAQALRKGTPALLLSLQMALQGIEKESSESGIIGKGLETIINSVNDLIIKSILQKEETGSQELFKLIIQALALTSISVAWKIEQLNLTTNEDGDEEELELNKLFGRGLILLMILRTEIVEKIVSKVASTCGADDTKKSIIAKLITALVAFLMILTLAKGSERRLRVMIIDLKDYLIVCLNDIQTFINFSNEDNKESQLSTMNIYIQQALSSLMEEDFETLVQAYNGALKEIDVNSEMMEEDIREVEKCAEIISNALMQGSLDHRHTASHMI